MPSNTKIWPEGPYLCIYAQKGANDSYHTPTVFPRAAVAYGWQLKSATLKKFDSAPSLNLV